MAIHRKDRRSAANAGKDTQSHGGSTNGTQKGFQIMFSHATRGGHGTSVVEIWKSCSLFKGTFYCDERMKMGRVASGQTRKRTSQIIFAIMKKDAAKLTAQGIETGRMYPEKVK